MGEEKTDVAAVKYVEASNEKNSPSTPQKAKTAQRYIVESEEENAEVHLSGCFCGDGCAHRFAKWFYAVIFILCAAIAVIIKWTKPTSLNNFSPFSFCETTICRGNQVIYRVSFTLAVFFLLLAIITICWKKIHFNMWFTKIIFLGALMTAAFFMPSKVFNVHREISRISSIIYLVIEVILLINMSYSIHDTLTGWMVEYEAYEAKDHTYAIDTNEEPGFLKRKAKLIYLGLSFTLLIASIVGVAMLFVFYGKCPLHNILIGVTFGVGSILVILSTLNLFNRGLLAPAILLAYTMFNLFGSLDSNPDAVCNQFAQRNNPIWMLILSIAFTVIAMGRSATSAADEAPIVLMSAARRNDDDIETNAIELDDTHYSSQNTSGKGTVVDEAALNKKKEKVSLEKQRSKYIFIYHFIMFLASCYLSMMLTGWGSENTDTKMNAPDRSEQSMWFKYGAICLTYLIYFWSLIAPVICKTRSFD